MHAEWSWHVGKGDWGSFIFCWRMFAKRSQISCSVADAAEKALATHSSALAWKIPWTKEPGGLKSIGSRRVGHDWATSLSLFTFMRWRRKWQLTPLFLPGESQGRGSLVGCCLWGRRVGQDWHDLAAAAAAGAELLESNFTGGFSCFPVHHWGPFVVSLAWSRKLVPGLRHPVLSATVSQFNVSLKKRGLGTSMVVQWLRLCSQCRGPRFDPWSDNQILHATAKKSHMLQRLQKIPHVATKPWHSQIQKY